MERMMGDRRGKRMMFEVSVNHEQQHEVFDFLQTRLYTTWSLNLQLSTFVTETNSSSLFKRCH